MTTPPPQVPPLADLVDDAPFTDVDLDTWLEQHDADEALLDAAEAALLPTEGAEAEAVEGVDIGVWEEPPWPHRWAISGTRSAEWAMAKLRGRRDAIAEIEATAEALRVPLLAQLERINEWVDAATAKDRRSAEFFEGHLQRWALRLRDESDTKSVKLPSGVVNTRETAATFEIADDAAAVAVARRHGVEVKESVTVTALKQVVAVVPFLVYIDEGDAGLRRVPGAAVSTDVDNDGRHIAIDPETGERLDPDRTSIDWGPHVIDVATGAIIDGLAVVPAKVTATVTITP